MKANKIIAISKSNASQCNRLRRSRGVSSTASVGPGEWGIPEAVLSRTFKILVFYGSLYVSSARPTVETMTNEIV